MMKPTGTCPPPSALEMLATGACTDGEVVAHVDECEACRAAVEGIRKDNQFLAGLRTALVASDPADPAHSPSLTTEAAPASVEPELVRGYEIQEEIHRGGQGVVYRAVQTRTRRTVAIKALLGWHSATARQKERFEREIRIAAGLRHPNIVTVHESGYISDGRYGLVMELIDGVPLDRWSRGLGAVNRVDGARGRDARRRDLRARLGVMSKVCDAVLCAHQHSIVHRDLKPPNILVDAAGEPHVLDFGIARDIGPEQHTRLTHTGEFAGTLAYASPEQVSGDLSKEDTRSDIYSLGVILYELVSGRMPYAVDGSMAAALRNIESGEPTPLSRRSRDPDEPWVDGEVSTIVLKALSKDPARRYQTAAGLRDDIDHYLAGQPIEARRDSTWYVLRKTASRHRVVVAAAGLFFVMLAAFGAAMAWQAHRLAVRGRELEVRARELASALSASNVERGRALAAAGNIVQAEAVVWPELIRAGVTSLDGPNVGFVGSTDALHAYWALWEIFQRSSRVATLRIGTGSADLLYFDTGGRRLNSVSSDGRLVSWSTETWEQVRDTNLVTSVDKAVFQAAVAPSGNIAIFGGGALRIINPETGVVEAEAADADAQAVAGTFSPNGTLLATIGRDGGLRLRDAHSLADIVAIAEKSVCKNSGDYSLPSFSPDGGVVAAALPDGALGLWGTTSGALERTLRAPKSMEREGRVAGFPRRISFGSDGAIAALLGNHVVVWPRGGEDPLDLGEHHVGLIASVAFATGSAGELLVSSGGALGGGSGNTILWNAATGARAATLKHLTVSATCTASPDGRLVAVGGFYGGHGIVERMVQVFDAAAEPYVQVLHAEDGRGSVASVSLDGKTVAFAVARRGQAGQDVVVVDLESGATRGRFRREGSPISILAFAPDGLSLMEGQWNGRITQVALPAGTVEVEFVAPDAFGAKASGHTPTPVDAERVMSASNMRLSPQGTVLARAGPRGLDLWEVPSGRWIDCLDSGTDPSPVIEFSPDGATLAVRASNKCVMWDVEHRTIKRSMDMGGYGWMRFSPDGAVLASGVYGSIQFFDAGSGSMLSENKDPGSAGTANAFHPSGNLFFASSASNAIRVWDVRTGRELLSLSLRSAAPTGSPGFTSLLVTPDGNTLISCDTAGTVLGWDLSYNSGRILRELKYQASLGEEP